MNGEKGKRNMVMREDQKCVNEKQDVNSIEMAENLLREVENLLLCPKIATEEYKLTKAKLMEFQFWLKNWKEKLKEHISQYG